MIYIGAILSWLFPGLGHILCAKNIFRGLLISILLLFIFFFGFALTDFRTIQYNIWENPYFYFSKYGSLFFYLMHEYVLKLYPSHKISISYQDIGLLYMSCAGYLNALSLIYIKPIYFTETEEKNSK